MDIQSQARQPPALVRMSSSSLTASSLPGGLGSFSSRSTPAATPPPPGIDARLGNGQPVIYTAVYSGVPVYEMTVNNVAVMRRREDSWLNATQILKVAGVEKGKRTKVLEKEILAGKHEKVQGGYGKYQGTWIDFQRGKEFCRAYGVEDLLAPLLELDTAGADGMDSTPTKEQAMAAKRKRMYNSSVNSAGLNGGGFGPMSQTVTNAFTALSKANQRTDSPGPRGSFPQTCAPGIVYDLPGSQESQRAPPSLISETSFPLSQQTVADSTYASQSQFIDPLIEGPEPPRKRPRGSTPVNELQTEVYVENPGRPLPPIDPKTVENAEQVKQTLMNLFIDPNVDAMAALEGLTPEQVDIPLDDLQSAAIHWAASLARVPLIRALITRGASIYRVNEAGETALVRGCFCTNNFDTSSFPQLLNLLHPTIAIPDHSGRTILHHIALKSGMKGRSADGRYYLHCLLEFIAKHGSSSSSTGGGPKVMNLGRFITEIVNAQDRSGDTALNIAARIGNKSIVQPLLEVGADSSIPNRAGLKPLDFGIGGDPVPVQRGREQNWTVPQAVVQKREDIVKSMQDLITGLEKDFQTELSTKQERVSSTLNNLREVTLKLGKEREASNQLRQRVREHSDLRQHCRNLRRSIEEENARLASLASNSPDVPLTNGDSVPHPEAEFHIPDLSPISMLSAPTSSNPATWTPEQREFLKSLPSTKVLQARAKAAKANNESLREKAGRLHDRSTELEEKFRRVVALCTGVEEDKVDSLLEGLVQAVESDPGEVDTVRVTQFLRKVEESGGSD